MLKFSRLKSNIKCFAEKMHNIEKGIESLDSTEINGKTLIEYTQAKMSICTFP